MNLPLFDNEPQNKSAVLFCDGASSGNPGKAGIGVVLIIDDERIAISESLGIATNNSPEYQALIRGIREARSRSVTSLSIYSDSELLVKQIRGEYKTKHPALLPLYQEARQLLASLASFSIEHIRREKNREADSLAKKAVSKR